MLQMLVLINFMDHLYHTPKPETTATGVSDLSPLLKILLAMNITNPNKSTN